MAIVKMKKIMLFAVRSQKDSLLNDLMHLGCVELTEHDILLRDTPAESLVSHETSESDKLRTQQSSLTHSLELINQYAPAKSKMFELRPELSASALLDESELANRLELAGVLEYHDSQFKRLSALETQQKSLIESLIPWESYDLELDYIGTKYSSLIIGAVPVAVELDDVDVALSENVPEAQILRISSHQELHYLALVCLSSRLSEAMETMRAFGFSVSSLKTLNGTAAENIAQTEARLAEIADEKNTLCEKIAGHASDKNELKLTIDLLGTKIAKAEAANRLLGTERAFSLVGWITAPQEKELTETLSKYDCAWELTEPEPDESEQVPICIKSSWLTRPLMMVTEMYSLPAYSGIDPNPLIAPFFTIFFGIMYADMGYGLILLILGILGGVLLKPRGTLKYATGLLKLCGTTTILFGALFGSFFGDSIPVFTNMIGIGQVEIWSLIDPLKEPMTMLIASLVIGVVQIFVGMAINAFMLIRDKKWLDALFDVGSWWLLFAGIALGALGTTWWVALAGATALVLTQGRNKPSIAGKIIGGLASLYNITSYMGDILSYTRLMALLLASSVIASVVNVLGSLNGSVITFIIVFLIGHAFNMGISIIGTFVHSARLQYLEFFGKFYKDGGRAFAPLKIKTKYYDIVKEEN